MENARNYTRAFLNNFITSSSENNRSKYARLSKTTITIPSLPSMMDIDEELKSRKQSYAIRDWSSKDPVKGEVFEMRLNYDYREEITGNYKDVADVAKQEGVKPLKMQK